MAKKGENKKQKRITAKKELKIKRKEATWVLKVLPGKTKKNEMIPLGIVLRNYLNLAENIKEVKNILNNNEILVNGIRIKNKKFGITLYDILSIPLMKKNYKVIINKKGKFDLIEVNEEESKKKISRIKLKKKTKKGKIMIVTNDGNSFVLDKSSLKPGDSILIDFNGKKIIKEIKLKEGTKVFIASGKHAGENGIIKEMIKGNERRGSLVKLLIGEKEFQTPKDYVIAIE